MNADRDALLVLLAEYGYDGAPARAKLADAILALGHPVEGVTITLTPEEAADLVVAVSVAADRLTGDGWAPRLRALVARLEAAQ